MAGTALCQQALIRFRDASRETGIRFRHHDAPPVPPLLGQKNTQFGVGAAVSDYDNDGDPDVYLCDSYGWPNLLYRNNGDGTFSDVTEAAGVGSLGYSHMALFLDLDNNGFDDLVVINDNSSLDLRFPGSQIFRNNGDGSFTDVTPDSGFVPVDPVFGGATAGDYDQDGDLDLFVVGWYEYSTYLYRNEGGFQFTDVTDSAQARPTGQRAQWTPLFVDVDNDGRQDIFCAVDFQEDYLLHNNGDGTFTDFSASAGTLHVANDMGVAVADFDNDLDLDLYTTNITGPEDCNSPAGCNMLYVNDGAGHFSDQTLRHGLGDTAWGWGVWFFDADLDGDRDLLAVNGWMQPQWVTPANFFVNDGEGRFLERARQAHIAHEGNTRSLVPLDFDQDGDVDFLLFDVLAPATVYRNVTPHGRNRYLVVEAEGRLSNRNGVGTRVYVEAGGRVQMGEILVGGSFYAGPPLEAHFGLGPVERVDTIVAIFPSGREVRLLNVLPDQRVRLLEPAAQEASPRLQAGRRGGR
ncbi:MAG: CRTAC1 family protein [Acidobacteriota bacterium]